MQLNLSVGGYELQVGSMPQPVHMKRSDEPELDVLSGGERLLQQVARSSGRVMFPIDQISRSARLSQQAQRSQPQSVEHSLWNGPYLFLFVLACFGAEWAF